MRGSDGAALRRMSGAGVARLGTGPRDPDPGGGRRWVTAAEGASSHDSALGGMVRAGARGARASPIGWMSPLDGAGLGVAGTA